MCLPDKEEDNSNRDTTNNNSQANITTNHTETTEPLPMSTEDPSKSPVLSQESHNNSNMSTQTPPVPPEISAPTIIRDDDNNNNTQDLEEPKPTCWERFVKFYWANEFVILIVIVILLARAYPPLGAVYLAPHITATWIAVVFIFIMAGLGLKTEELTNAFKQIRFNLFVQTFNFGLISVTVFGVSRLLIELGILDRALADGMVVCACLPLTINMVCVLTKSAGGDEAAAIFNAAFGNMCGVFLSPVLILGYLGVTGDVDLFQVFYKLCLRVVLPVAIGQLLQKFSKTVVQFVKLHKPKFKQAQQYALVFIVYTVFCRTFNSDEGKSEVGDIFLMILFQFLLLVFFMIVAWILLGWFFPKSPELRVMGLFGCTHKTVAMGVPLINAIYESSPYVGQYTLPLLIWHPMQLLLGSFLVPKLVAFVEREHERLGVNPDGEDEDKNNRNNSTDNNNQTDEEAPAPPEEPERDQGSSDESREKEDEVHPNAESMLTGSYHTEDMNA
ncbi:bile acid cotransporter 7 [Seminavis robusta]|uniref:Bile acid cotransporter 7 n=1 Tax=Seminavis robusta TaxID=568900 RepID=A0A9N8HE06_9STRA|nr:bile acid cotransporter 7 [Seminavis robusta]|eukprot:Sro450_g145610.1 bile acid cotransporter 7 (501) ;mRNA; f:46980-48736